MENKLKIGEEVKHKRWKTIWVVKKIEETQVYLTDPTLKRSLLVENKRLMKYWEVLRETK